MFTELPVIFAGGGITAALALRCREYAVQVIERAPELGEIGAGDRVVGRIDGVGEIELRVGAAY